MIHFPYQQMSPEEMYLRKLENQQQDQLSRLLGQQQYNRPYDGIGSLNAALAPSQPEPSKVLLLLE